MEINYFSAFLFISLFVLSLIFYYLKNENEHKNNANHSLHWKYSEIVKKEKKETEGIKQDGAEKKKGKCSNSRWKELL